jgi:hypothetical protein
VKCTCDGCRVMLMRRQDRVADYALLPRAATSRALDARDGSFRRHQRRFALARLRVRVCVQGCGCAWQLMHVCWPTLHRCNATLTSPRIHYARCPQDPLCTPCLEHGEVSLSCADRDRVVSLQWSEKFWLLVDHLQIFAALWVAECAAAGKRFPQSWCTGSQMLVYIRVNVFMYVYTYLHIYTRAHQCV